VPFPPQKPKPFDREAVESSPTGSVGCYGLFRRDRWIFIGKGDIRQALLGHLQGDVPAILLEHPTHWVAVETPDYDAMQRELVLACDPVCKDGAPTQKVQDTGRCGSGR
jgi:hypothetical protein